MEDFELTIENKESLKIYTYEGRKIIEIFIWKQEEHKLTFTVGVNQEEKNSLSK